MLQIIFGTVVALGLLVTVHEFGHFWVARRCGVKVLRFSIGFGKPLLTWHDRRGTEFALAAIPLGGYVKMLDERETPVAPEELGQAFNRKPVGQRIAIVVAGPAANFILAVVAYWFMFMAGISTVAPVIGKVLPDTPAYQAGVPAEHEIVAIDEEKTPTWQAVSLALLNHVGETADIELQLQPPGQAISRTVTVPVERWLIDHEVPDVLGGLGIEPYRPAVPAKLAIIVPDSAAARAGLQEQDLVTAVDGEPIADWSALVDYVRQRPGEEVQLAVEREGRQLSVPVVLERVSAEDGELTGRLGVGVAPPAWPAEMQREVSYGVVGAAGAALQKTWDMTVLILESLKKMLTGLISVKNLSGPITIAQVAGDSVEQGLVSFLNFLAYLSISLGVINILPIPLLDGGHLMYYLAELVRGKPVSEKAQMLGLRIGIGIIMALMFFALYNDLTRLL